MSANHGTLRNGAAFAAGEVGRAFTFDGADDYVEVPHSANISFGSTSPMSFEFWAYRSGSASVQHVFGKRIPGSGVWGINYQVALEDTASFYGSGIIFITGAGNYAASGTPMPIGQWTHVAGTFDGSTLRLYVNGELKASAAGTLGAPNGDPLMIGGSGGYIPFGGLIDEVSMYSSTLSSTEVQAIYNAGSAGKCIDPIPPYIVAQPTNQTVTAGTTVTFSVTAGGTAPLSYQWIYNATNIIDGATSALLTLTNVQEGQAGDYAVLVSNAVDVVLSSNAVLTVNPLPDCLPPNMVSWWQAETNALDSVGVNHGTLRNGAAFAAGEVGHAFTFDGANDYVEVPHSANISFGSTSSMSFEFWAHRTGSASVQHVFGKRIPGSGVWGINYQVALEDTASFYGSGIIFITGAGNYAASGTPMPIGQWTHVAGTFDGSTLRLYVNGELKASAAGTLGAPNGDPLMIGGSGGYIPFGGLIDEVSIYNRTLSSNEVQAIYNAGSAGKCVGAIPPYIVAQPTNQAVTVGATVTFNVTAGGTEPLGYQWKFNETNIIAGATNASITLNNVQLNQAGNYSVAVSNMVDTVTSSNALLTVNAAPPCAPVTTSLISWWQAESNALDGVTGNHGTLRNGAAFGAGEVGHAFTFDGADDYVEVPHSANISFGSTSSMSFEFWAYRSGSTPVQHVFGKRVPGSGVGGINYQVALEDTASFYGSGIIFITGAGNYAASGTAMPIGQWTHVAGTFDGSTLRLYVNGELKASAAGTLGAPNGASLFIGGSGGYTPFGGMLDEVSIYNRALSTNEIQSIYNASSGGKCVVPVPPFIVTQPASQTVTIGGSVTLGVTAGGTSPLSYQWYFNSTNIVVGATNGSLTLSNVQTAQAGSYSVVVSSVVDVVTSSNAVLTVNFPPAPVRVVSTNGSAGEPISVPVILVANGNENALGFSLNFQTQRLVFASVTLGSGAGGGSLLLNTNLVVAGRVGMAVSLPSGTNFAAGTQEVVRVNFTSAILGGTNAVVTPLTFGDQPTTAQLSDAQAHVLAATYANGTVTLLPSDLEGDSAPRPTGDRALAITDWVQVGRFVAGLDIAADGGEFQRAECAPRATLGDGIFKVTDWVQAGRYAAGLDPLTIAGGPTSPVEESGSAVQPSGLSVASVSRQVMVVGATAIQGLTVSVPVNLVSQGDETAVGFSLVFSSNAFTYASTSLGSGAAGATLNLNTSQVAIGKLGMTVGFPSGSFAVGTHELIKVNLIPTSAALGNYSIAFGNSPVPKAISDPGAYELTADYIPGAVTVNPVPSLSITQSGGNVNLSWPLWAGGFNLQASENNMPPFGNWTNVVATLQTNGSDIVVTMPASETTKFFRLHHP